eukprot:TRINITY_DN67316_c0_g1_i1.p1 TRINITY_DN67316_c0_g1~~TRINITY_DN67316_c0_g1_i1.p1  ORF type:complete len:1711 (-),score=269.05 TRINITY_DN67316_c0_g1_i1:387-4796(-)
MFPDPRVLPRKSEARLSAALRRECRGLLVCASTGVVLARRLPKFFNVDELDETRVDKLPPGGVAAEKLDGSLVSPFLLEGSVRWAGKAELVPSVEAFAASHIHIQRAAEIVRQGCTPIFEWCEQGPPVGVIGHGESRLVLLGVRDIVTGEFWEHERLLELECDMAKRVPFEDVDSFLRLIRSQMGTEGVVISWPELGFMVKCKTLWWITLAASQKKGSGKPALALHSALQTLPLASIPTSAVWQAVLSANDDELSLMYSRLPSSPQSSLRAFATAVDQGIQALDQEMREWSECARDATEVDIARVAGGWPVSVLAAYQRRVSSAERELRRFLAKMAHTGELLGLESIVGASWSASHDEIDFCGHLGTFDVASPQLVTHVLDIYLPRKLEAYLGCEAVGEDTAVRVEPLYEPSEGKLKGLWEKFVSEGIIDLRVDLQPRANVFDFHSGDTDFALWQVQFGPNDNCRRSTKAREGDRQGAFAGVLMRTGVDVAFKDLRNAFELSFRSRQIVKFDPSPSKLSHIFMDLDGVLVDFDAGFESVFGCLPEPKTRWQYIEKTPGFYDRLPWLDGARKLWEHVLQTGLPVTILSGVPEGVLGDRSAEEKLSWVARELGNVELVTCLSREKPIHSGHGRLLIDDRPQRGWELVGGRQIVHRSVPDTFLALVNMGLGRNFEVSRQDVSLVTTLTEELRAAGAGAEVVALDAEWPPDRAGATPNCAVVLQLAFKPKVTRVSAFVVDMLAWDEELKAYVRELLAAAEPRKLVFGPGDAARLGLKIASVTDMQEEHLSLVAQARRCGLVIKKPKQLQAADWSLRPLRDEQIVYAATDALILLELSGGHVAKTNLRLAKNDGKNVSVEYTGVFLTSDSRQKLLRRVPPRFGDIVADHFTLAWKPESVTGLAVGASVKLKVEAAGWDDGVQAVSVVSSGANPHSGHITVSHRSDVATKDANCLSFQPIDSFMLEGVIGVCVVLKSSDVKTLPEKVLARVHSLREGQPGESDRFESLTDSQRHALHVLANEFGLDHRSEGKKGTPQRKLILTVPKHSKKPVCGHSECERIVVKDARKFASLFGDIPGLRVHGCLKRGGSIAWEVGVSEPPLLVSSSGHHAVDANRATSEEDPGVAGISGSGGAGQLLAIILRGFPGSGKSSLSSFLQRQCAADIVCADDFWQGREHLQDAHDKCRQLFSQALETRRPVIIDNTNVRLSDYSFYRNAAEAAGYRVVVLEIICESTADLERLRKRSVHGVSGASVGAMWARWEHDPVAWRLAPFAAQELMPWLTEQGMLGHPPNTHLIMPRGPFLSVPAASRGEFFERFAAEWGMHYISEQARAENFQLFFDVDRLSFGDLLPALRSLRRVVGVPLVITGTAEDPPGYHVFAPGKCVDVTSALDYRRQWLEEEPSLERHVDREIYTGGKQSFFSGGRGPALRLLGSRKISKEGIDMGRVHAVVGRFDEEWQEDFVWQWSDVSIQPP